MCGEEDFLGREVLLQPGRGRGVVAVAGQRVGRLPQEQPGQHSQQSAAVRRRRRAVSDAVPFSPIRPIQPAKAAAAHW